MRQWNNPDERRQAVRLFIEYLHKPENKSDREKCKKNPGGGAFAKQLLAQVGDIQGIPTATEFHVYEKIEIEPRDEEYAVFVLPDPTKPLPGRVRQTDESRAADVSEVYRCTWDPWAAHRMKNSQDS
jgi:hypothetical protein